MLEEELICDQCHKRKPDVTIMLDPYALEINDEEVEMQLCEDCASDRRDDI